MSSDAEQLQAWAAGDTDAGEALIERHFEALYRFFRNKVGGDVHDLVQDTFLRAMESTQSQAVRASFRAFLFGVARRVLYDHLRRIYRDRETGDLEEASAADLDPTPSQLVARHEEHRVLLEALRRIPLDDQIALELVYWEELPGEDVAAILGVNPNTARSRLRRARQALARQLERLCESPALLASTLDNLDRWARSVREMLAHEGHHHQKNA